MLHDAADSGNGANLFIGMVPIDVQRDFLRDTTTYIAWHRDFAEIPNGQVIPEYEAVFDEGSVIPRWVAKRS